MKKHLVTIWIADRLKWGHGLIFLLSSLVILSCKTPEENLPSSDEEKPTTVIAGNHTINPNPPPEGTKSLFDHLIGHEIPESFEELIYLIEQKAGRHPLGVLFPFSRSLQRRTVSLQFPRVLLTVKNRSLRNSQKQLDRQDVGINIEGRLFIGYSEKAEQLEIISYNEDAGRYEFQIVKNFASKDPEKRAVINYANREFCAACHQDLGPLFPDIPWSETNASDVIEGKLRKYHPNQEKIHGVPINHYEKTQADFRSDSVGNPYRYDTIIRSIHNLPFISSLWTQFCGSDDEQGAFCRARFLLLMLLLPSQIDPGFEGAFEEAAKPVTKEVATMISRQWPNIVSGSNANLLPHNAINEFDPLEAQSKNFNASDNDHRKVSENLNEIKSLFQDVKLTPLQNPLTPKEPSIVRLKFLDWQLERALTTLSNPFTARDSILLSQIWDIYRTEKIPNGPNSSRLPATKYFVDRLRQPIENLIKRRYEKELAAFKAGKKFEVFSSKPINRFKVMIALLAEDNVTEVRGCCITNTDLDSNKDSIQKSIGKDIKAMKTFVDHCGNCHGSGSDYPIFDGKTDRQVCQSMLKWHDQIPSVLQWQAGNKLQMPPSQSARQKIEQEERGGNPIRKDMNAIIKRIKSSGCEQF